MASAPTLFIERPKIAPPKANLEQDNVRGVDLAHPRAHTANATQLRHGKVRESAEIDIGIAIRDGGAETCICITTTRGVQE